MKDNLIQFAICVQNQDCEDLDLLKLYQVLIDNSAAQDDYIRIIDESGEDYIYPKNNFIVINFSSQIEKTLLPLFKMSA
ncbi:hypothetical protein PN36_15905 [Candidatus Thiomargarita nelsonii]|uniref:Uncharacterized protein n=1 Tax=Candidatus Thiomargarita nelsonii TaxID=1003181 RepID=A0A0A6RV12_9GAMM|nr:hypothetical protein PN36_15905 [Candidatus Thiomargarita nelsonii]